MLKILAILIKKSGRDAILIFSHYIALSLHFKDEPRIFPILSIVEVKSNQTREDLRLSCYLKSLGKSL